MSMSDGSAADPAVSVIVVAAGGGTRLGAGVPKAFAPLAGGTVLETALASLRRATIAAQLVLVVPPDLLEDARRLARRVYGDAHERLVGIVPGGAERADSVAAGLAAVAPSARVVLVHDAARALTPPELFDAVAARTAEAGCGVVPVLPVHDTVKRLGPDGEVADTLARAGLAIAQTPQGFPRDLLARAYRSIGPDATAYTDDAAIVSAAGGRVVSMPGSELAFKITLPQDLARAEGILGPAAAAAGELRTGVGVDAHAFAPGVPLMLAGVAWPDEPEGLAGHSDGDPVCHAIVDALLSAAGLGDIGSVFGTDDPALLEAPGSYFLQETTAHLARNGWSVRNVAVEIVANRPRIGPRRAEIEAALSALLDAPVTVAGTTTDGLGLTGEGRGVGAIATALVARP